MDLYLYRYHPITFPTRGSCSPLKLWVILLLAVLGCPQSKEGFGLEAEMLWLCVRYQLDLTKSTEIRLQANCWETKHKKNTELHKKSSKNPPILLHLRTRQFLHRTLSVAHAQAWSLKGARRYHEQLTCLAKTYTFSGVKQVYHHSALGISKNLRQGWVDLDCFKKSYSDPLCKGYLFSPGIGSESWSTFTLMK